MAKRKRTRAGLRERERTDKDDGALLGHVEAADDLDVVEEDVDEDAEHAQHQVPKKLVPPHALLLSCSSLALLLSC
jgi:hypothetical protein